jgi:DHA2 family multidrug resistance protein
MIFFVFVNLFGSIVIILMYLERLMGYTSTLAGLVLAPGGVLTLMVMPIVGLLITRINSKGIVIAGIVVTAYSISNVHVQHAGGLQHSRVAKDYYGYWRRLDNNPAHTLTLSRMKKEQMGNARSIFNLVRNIGGSFGVAISTSCMSCSL